MRQVIAKIEMFQSKIVDNLTSSLSWVTSKSTNPAEAPHLVCMETWSYNNFDEILTDQ